MSRHGLIVGSAAAAIALAAAGCGSELAGEPGNSVGQAIDRDERRGLAIEGDAPASSLHYASQLRLELGLSPEDDFAMMKSVVGIDGRHHTRLQQTHAGVPVWGADVVVHATDDEILAMSGSVMPGIHGVATTAAVAPNEALAIAERAYGAGAPATAELRFERETAELVIYPHAEGISLCWRTEFYTEHQAGIEPGLWNTFVDARTGEIVGSFNAIHTLSQASGPGGNPKAERVWEESLDVEAAGSEYEMETELLQTVDMGESSFGGSVVTGPLEDIGDPAANDAHGFAEATLDMLDAWMGMNSIDDDGFRIRSRVHYGRDYENAFWNGREMTYGDGDTLFYPLSGDIDVVSHEVHHGFTTFHSDLIYAGKSGGLNESFSDIAGVAASFFFDEETADFEIGADVFQEEGAALRYMCDPPRDGSSIGHADDYTSGMDVHYSSGVSNRAFCLASRRLSGNGPDGEATTEGIRRAARAWFLANQGYWTRSSDFVQGCQGVMDAAAALGYDGDDIGALLASWADVGVTCEGEVGNVAPTVAITAPADGDAVSGVVDIAASADDEDGEVSRVAFELPDGSTREATEAPFAVTWDSVTVSDGEDYAIRAVAYDAEGMASEPAAIAVSVENGGESGWSASDEPNLATVDDGEVCTSVDVSAAGDAADVHIDLEGIHDWRSSLRATLAHGGVAKEVFGTGTFPRAGGAFSLEAEPVEGFSGSATGAWTLCVIDTDGFGDTGELARWRVHDGSQD